MAGLPARGERGDAEFTELDSSIVKNTTQPPTGGADSVMDVDPPTAPPQFIPPSISPHGPPAVQSAPTRQLQQQQLFPGAPPPKDSKPADRCAVCVKAFCLKRFDCAGNGNRAKCHPPLRKGEKVRIPEEKILAYWEERHPAARASG
ncbi:hypothetical protein B0H10DRAFT_1977595 [Mycena sp. CBHHK59/15]|nr:hypothetical protein B0H10DRAFT_1977595 [Mycena sp. CBHHK59/15]